MIGAINYYKEYDSMTLVNFINQNCSFEILQLLFYKMDITMQYIHEHGYCIDVFNPNDILILTMDNGLSYEIIFKKLMKLPVDNSSRKYFIKEDILRSALFQISTYVYNSGLKIDYNTFLNGFNMNFIRDNYESIEKFLPSELITYYNGIINRSIYNYLNKFMDKKKKFDSQNNDEQSMNSNSSKVLKLSSSNIIGVGPINESIDEWNYRKINGLQDKAFVQALLVPSLALIIVILFGLVAWVISMLSI